MAFVVNVPFKILTKKRSFVKNQIPCVRKQKKNILIF